jgi:hypothetical protein
MSFAVQAALLSSNYAVEDIHKSTTIEAIVVGHVNSIRTLPLDSFGLEDTPGEYSALRGLSVTDDAEELFQVKPDKSPRWVIELYAVEGDFLVEDPRGAVEGRYGSELSNRILITSRKTLIEDEDYVFLRELSEDDEVEEDEDEYGDFREDPEEYGDLDYDDEE